MAYYNNIETPGVAKIITEATANPITLADIKLHLSIFDTADDTYLAEILLAAQQQVSQFLGEYVSPTTLRVDVCCYNTIRLPQKQVASITSVQYYDVNNNLQTLASSNYIFDDSSDGAYIVFTGNSLPQLSNDYVNPIRVTYVANIPSTPDTVRQAIRIVAGEMYQTRSLSTNNNVQSLPLQVQYLLSGLRRY